MSKNFLFARNAVLLVGLLILCAKAQSVEFDPPDSESCSVVPPIYCDSNSCVIWCQNGVGIEYFCVPERVNRFQQVELNLLDCSISDTNNWIPTELFRQGNRIKSLHVQVATKPNSYIGEVKNDTFKNLEQLEELTLKGFDWVKTVETDIFRPLVNLRKLTLIRFGAQFQTYRQLGDALNGLSNSALTHVTMDRVHTFANQQKTLSLTDLFRLTGVNITHLIFINNDFNAVEGTLSKTLPRLKYIEFSMYFLSFASQGFGLDPMVLLQEIEEVKYSFIGDIGRGKRSLPDSETCYPCVLNPELFAIYFNLPNTPGCWYSRTIPFSRSLKRFIIQNMDFYKSDGNPDICADAQLEYVDLFKSPMGRIGQFKGLQHVKYFNLQETNLWLISSRTFWEMPLLEILLLAGNNALGRSIATDTYGNLFKMQNSSLKTLDLASNDIDFIPYSIFSSLAQLQFLNLSRNRIENLEIDLNRCTNLKVINLAENSLRTLSDSMIAQLEYLNETQLSLTVDLSANPLNCLCNNPNFVTWVQTTNRVLLANNSSYTCLHANGSLVIIHSVDVTKLNEDCKVVESLTNGTCPCSGLNFVQLRQIALSLSDSYCSYNDRRVTYMELVMNTNRSLGEYWWCKTVITEEFPFYKSPKFLVPIVLGSLLLIGLAVALFVMYKKRYTPSDIANMIQCMDMRPYMMYVIRALTRHPASNPEPSEYDVFVYFQEDDASWTRSVLLSKLGHLKVITSHDFIIGAAMIDAILESIQKCRAIVLVLSPSFKDDQWCREVSLRSYTLRPSSVIPVVTSETDLDIFNGDTLFWNIIATNNPIDLTTEENDDRVWQSLMTRISSA